jgi:hypothetical protein
MVLRVSVVVVVKRIRQAAGGGTESGVDAEAGEGQEHSQDGKGNREGRRSGAGGG